jgi:hypothetical protein
MDREVYTKHKQEVDTLLRSIMQDPAWQEEPEPPWWEAYDDEHAKAIWAGLFHLYNDPATDPAVAARAKTLWEVFLHRNRG